MGRKDKEDWARKCLYMDVEGTRPRGRPRKTWLKVVRSDINWVWQCGCSGPSCLEEEDCRGLAWSSPGDTG